MKLTIDEKKQVAIIELPLQPPRLSATGNTSSVAECRNQQTEVPCPGVPGKTLKVTAQVYFKP